MYAYIIKGPNCLESLTGPLHVSSPLLLSLSKKYFGTTIVSKPLRGHSTSTISSLVTAPTSSLAEPGDRGRDVLMTRFCTRHPRGYHVFIVINYRFTTLGLGCGHSELPLPLPSVRLIKWAERRRFYPRSDDFQTGLRGCFVDFYVILSENQ